MQSAPLEILWAIPRNGSVVRAFSHGGIFPSRTGDYPNEGYQLKTKVPSSAVIGPQSRTCQAVPLQGNFDSHSMIVAEHLAMDELTPDLSVHGVIVFDGACGFCAAVITRLVEVIEDEILPLL